MTGIFELLTDALGYQGDHGFIAATSFAEQPNHRHALRLASQIMNVRAAFGLWTGREGALLGPERARFTPLVYLAEAQDAADAKQVHRSVWSQGLAPYLIIAGPDRAWVCQGFSFSSDDWGRHSQEVPIGPDITGSAVADLAALQPLRARALRSSVAWRDEARTADEFIDERLLRSLADLSVAFARETEKRRALAPTVINALIARLLYFYFLVDRRFITTERLSAWELDGIGLDEGRDWSLDDSQRLFRRLDEVFNGSIFPMPEACANGYDETHLNLLRRVLRHGAQLGTGDALQLSFLDYDFASIRTETLSAIYEMFLRNEVEDAGTSFGAFYTPPYLADYTLDRLEDQSPLRPDTRVLDPAAGSGVFLVGAYRRIVESALPVGQGCLPLERLHALMTGNIFGIELNATACHVAAFSLYLTMLDYVDGEEAADYTNWPVLVGRPRLFPPMLTSVDGRGPNIRATDFFSPDAARIACDLVVGNPPWVQLKKLRSAFAIKDAKARRAPIGDGQAAELFLWKAFEDHLVDGGMLGLLLPQKSLVNASSDKFTRSLRSRAELVGIADLAHLRYALFRRSGAQTAGSVEEKRKRGARQSTAIVMLRKQAPAQDHQFWHFRPLRSTQPASRSGRLWTLIHDWTQVSWYSAAEIGDASWRRLFTCSPVDRRILRKLDAQVSAGRVDSLRQLNELVGLQFKIETDQYLERRFVLSSDRRKPTYWRRQLGLEQDLAPVIADAIPLPQEQIDRAHPLSRPFLMGNVVLMPRTCEQALFVEPPAATSFFIVGCFPQFAGMPLPEKRRAFLLALAAYMSTRTFRYLCFVNSRRMTIDRANAELAAVLELPWPFGDLESDDWLRFLDADLATRDAIVCEVLGLPPLYRQVVAEFDDFRARFADGGTPVDAMRPSEDEQLKAYVGALLHEVGGTRQRYHARTVPLEGDLLATIIQYRLNRDSLGDEETAQFVSAATGAYARQGASALTQSRYLWHSPEEMTSVLIKPRQRLHWTLERAFADADLVTAAAMSGINGQAVA